MERKLRFFESEVEKAKLEINGAEAAATIPAPDQKGMEQMEAEFEKIEREVGLCPSTQAIFLLCPCAFVCMYLFACVCVCFPVPPQKKKNFLMPFCFAVL